MEVASNHLVTCVAHGEKRGLTLRLVVHAD